MTDNDVENHADPDRGMILFIYGLFGLSIILTLIPNVIVAGLSLVALLLTMILTYMFRARRPEDSLMHNHMVFIIRTIWIGGFLMIFTLIAGAGIMLYGINNAPLQPCIDKFIGSVNPDTISMNDVKSMSDIFGACMNSYIGVNWITFLISGVVAAGPILLYFFVRFARGMGRAISGYRLANPQAWF